MTSSLQDLAAVARLVLRRDRASGFDLEHTSSGALLLASGSTSPGAARLHERPHDASDGQRQLALEE